MRFVHCMAALAWIAACGDANVAGSQSPPVVVDDGGPYPAPHPPLPLLANGGGPVIADMKLVTVTFDGDTSRDAYRQFDDAVVASDWWTAITAEYGVHAGHGGAYVELPDVVSHRTMDDTADIQPLVRDLVVSGTLPPPDANTVYAFYFPPSTQVTALGHVACVDILAYHNYVTVSALGGSVNVPYVVMAICDGHAWTEPASHELIEVATDPHPTTTFVPRDPPTYYAYNDAWFGNGGAEIADMCNGLGNATAFGASVVLGWSNAAARASKNPCVPSDPTKIFFGAAFATDALHAKEKDELGPDYDTQGYIVVPRGGSRDVDVTIFSDAKLPHDLTIGVYAWLLGGIVDVKPVGASWSLSRTTAHNGDHATLTLRVDAETKFTDYAFVVRASLNDDDHHDWHGILHVQ